MSGLLLPPKVVGILDAVARTDLGDPISRRCAVMLIGGAAATLAGCASRGPDARRDSSGGRATTRPLGIQLYTLRRAMQDDLAGTLAAVREIGYREVELAGLHGLTPAAFRTLLDRHGLSAISTHIGLDELNAGLERVISDARILGNRWIICPWIDEKDRTPDGYRRIADDFNRIGAEVMRAGMRFGYHNHDYPFRELPDGSRGYDILLERTDPSIVDMEMDVFWAVKGGQDPVSYLDRAPTRFSLIHAKDMDASGNMVDVGKGRIDFRAIMQRVRTDGIGHVFVEHDEPPSPLESARVSYAALREILAR